MTRSQLIPEVEPLSERTWQSVEDRVFERLEQQRPEPATRRHLPGRLSLGLASLSLAASLFALVQVMGHGEEEAPVPPASELARAVEVDQQSAPAPSDLLQNPSPAPPAPDKVDARIVTTKGPIERRLGKSRLLISNHSELRVKGNDTSGWEVSLARGSVNFRVAPRLGRPDFLVKADDVLVRVIGTQFDVKRSERGTSVAVEEGHVLVEKNGSVTSLEAGDTWSDHEQPIVAEPHKVDPPPRRRSKAKRSKKSSRHAESSELAEDFSRATALEVRRPEVALKMYQRLSRSNSDWSAPALFAQARLLYDRGRVEEARRALKKYQANYPNGMNAADVKELLSRIEPPRSQ